MKGGIMDQCLNRKCGKPRYPGMKFCSVNCKRIVQGLAPIVDTAEVASRLSKKPERAMDRLAIAASAPTKAGTTGLDAELELRQQGFSTVKELARELNRSGPGLFIALQQKKVTKKTIPGIRAAFYCVAEAVERIGPKGAKQVSKDPSAESASIDTSDFEKDAAELDQALLAAGRTDLVETKPAPARRKKVAGGGVISLDAKGRIRPITKLLARQAIVCERSGLHEAERVLLWMTIKSVGLLNEKTLHDRKLR
jgi:hypothetical protein